MRIIIESNEMVDIVQSMQGETKPTPMDAMDGGTPPEMLVQAITGATPNTPDIVSTVGGINAGPPPEWLVAAIQGATSVEY